MTINDLEQLLKGDNGVQITLLQERLDCLHQVGKNLIENYKGKSVKLTRHELYFIESVRNLWTNQEQFIKGVIYASSSVDAFVAFF